MFIVNRSADLSFRDFKKATNISNKLDLEIIYASSNDLSQIQRANIIFITCDYFMDYIKKVDQETVQNICCIVDEFDSILFESYDKID